MNSERKAFIFRVLVIIFTAAIWLIGAAVLGVSVWLRLDFWINQYVGASEELAKYTIGVYVLIAAGSCIIVFGIVGIYGAVRPDKCAIVVYLIFLMIVFGLLIGGGAYGYIYRIEIEETVERSELLKNVLITKYGIDDKVTNAFNYMQLELECCGGSSYLDYKQSSWQGGDPGDTTGQSRKDKTPLTCCKDEYWKYKDSNSNDFKYCNIYKEDIGCVKPDCPVNPKVHDKGCGKAIVDFFYENIDVIGAVAFSIVGLVLLTIIMVALLLYYLRKAPPPQQDDVVYEMARTQEKSPYPTRGGPYANLYQS